MRKNNPTVIDVKNKLNTLLGQDIKMRVNKGRNKMHNFDAQIINIYPSVFVVKINSPSILETMSYSYTEVLCGTVKIMQDKK